MLGHGLVWCEQRALCRAGPAAQAPRVEDVEMSSLCVKVLGHGLVWCEQRALCRAGPAAQAPSVEDVLVNAFLRMDNDMSRYTLPP